MRKESPFSPLKSGLGILTVFGLFQSVRSSSKLQLLLSATAPVPAFLVPELLYLVLDIVNV